MPEKLPESVIFFDGVCNLCNASINFIIRHDKKGKYFFAPLQGINAKTILKNKDTSLHLSHLDTIILLEGSKVYVRSTAALRIAKNLSFPISVLYIFIVVPRVIRDFFYNFVSKRRYRIFGKQDACMVPGPEIKKRFLE